MSEPTVSLSSIDIKEVTSGKLTGDGSFDVLMKAITAHLDNQFKQQRITGSDYAQAYVQLTSAAIQYAVQFTVQTRETAAQEALLKAQTLATLWEARLKKTQELLTFEQIKLTAQKIVSELAQVDGTNIAPNSVLGIQNALMNKQKDGFDRDAEQKAAGVIYDVLKIRASADAVEPNEYANAGITSSNYQYFLNKLKEGIANN